MLLSDLRNEVRRRVDRENDPFISDAELTSWTNLAQKELYDLLIQQADFELSQHTYTTIAQQENYALPEDFYRLVGVEVQSADSDVWLTLKKYQFGERNRFTRHGPLPRATLRYRLLGHNLTIEPPPEGGLAIRIAYHPRPAEVADSCTLAHVLNTGDIPYPSALTLNGVSFDYGGLATLRTAILAEAANPLSALFGLVPVLSADNKTLTLSHPRPFRLDTVVIAPNVYASIWHWQNYVDGISGWEEYIIVDCAIRCLQKDNDDPSVYVLQKAALLQRIVSMSQHRDVSGPEVPTDTEGLCPAFQNVWYPGGY